MPAFDAIGMDAVGMGGTTSQGSSSGQQSSVTAVTITPTSATIAGGTTLQFNAVALGPNNPSQAMTWSTTAGSVDATGLVTTPATTPGNQFLRVTATSVQDPTKSAWADVAIPGSNPPSIGGLFQSRRRTSRRVLHLP